jgi:hypothetical protein
MMGRFIGVAFAGPMTYFVYKGMIPTTMYPRMAMLFSLGGKKIPTDATNHDVFV